MTLTLCLVFAFIALAQTHRIAALKKRVKALDNPAIFEEWLFLKQQLHEAK
jgi:hypothetical protein